MYQRFTLTLFTFALLLSVACSSQPASNTAPASAPGTAAPAIVYAQGFYDEEQGGDGNRWRWMTTDGVVRLKNTQRDMVLTIAGSSPTHVFKSDPTVTLTLNGAPLDQFAGKKEGVEKRYEIPAGKLGSGDYAELRISSDKSMVPEEVNKTIADKRRLAFQLGKLTWQEK